VQHVETREARADDHDVELVLSRFRHSRGDYDDLPRRVSAGRYGFTISGMRLHQLRPEELDAEQRALYDLLTADGRMVQGATHLSGVQMVDAEGRMEGPFNAWLTHAGIGWAAQEMSRRLRFDGVC